MHIRPIRADSVQNQSEIDDLIPIRPIYSDEPTHIGGFAQTILKRAVMAAWEHGAITNLEAWWIIQREGLQHK
jgi:hypothetical protein